MKLYYPKRSYETKTMYIWRLLWHFFCKIQFFCGQQFSSAKKSAKKRKAKLELEEIELYEKLKAKYSK